MPIQAAHAKSRTRAETGPSPAETRGHAVWAPAGVAGTLEERIRREVRTVRTRLALTGESWHGRPTSPLACCRRLKRARSPRRWATPGNIARILNVSLASIFAGTEARRDCSFVTADRGAQIDRRGTKAGHLYELLGHSVTRPVILEPYHAGAGSGTLHIVPTRAIAFELS